VCGLATGSLPHALFGSYVDLARGLGALVVGILMLITGWLSLRAIRLARALSLKVDAVAIHVRDSRGSQYQTGMRQIERLEVRKSFWLGTRTYVYLASGERHRLPQRVRDHDFLIDKIRMSAKLNRRYRQGRRDVYLKDAEYEGGPD